MSQQLRKQPSSRGPSLTTESGTEHFLSAASRSIYKSVSTAPFVLTQISTTFTRSQHSQTTHKHMRNIANENLSANVVQIFANPNPASVQNDRKPLNIPPILTILMLPRNIP